MRKSHVESRSKRYKARQNVADKVTEPPVQFQQQKIVLDKLKLKIVKRRRKP